VVMNFSVIATPIISLPGVITMRHITSGQDVASRPATV
jgi:hypothetical protein